MSENSSLGPVMRAWPSEGKPCFRPTRKQGRSRVGPRETEEEQEARPFLGMGVESLSLPAPQRRKSI